MSDRSLDQTGQMGGGRATRHLLWLSTRITQQRGPSRTATARSASTSTQSKATLAIDGKLEGAAGELRDLLGVGFDGAPEVVRRSTITNR